MDRLLSELALTVGVYMTRDEQDRLLYLLQTDQYAAAAASVLSAMQLTASQEALVNLLLIIDRADIKARGGRFLTPAQRDKLHNDVLWAYDHFTEDYRAARRKESS